MPIDTDSGLIEPDIIVNGRALTFAECMAVRVAVSSFRIALTAPSIRKGLGTGLANGYDHHLAHVEQTMIAGPSTLRHGYGCPHDGDLLKSPRPADCPCDEDGTVPGWGKDQ